MKLHDVTTIEGAVPPIVNLPATAWARISASPLLPLHTELCGTIPGAEVKPELLNAAAPASAAASAACWACPDATYRVTTSIANTAMANSETIPAATIKIVTPRSSFRDDFCCARLMWFVVFAELEVIAKFSGRR